MRRSVRFLSAPSSLKRVQDLVAPINPGAGLLLPRKHDGILDVANDPPVHEVKFRREVELDRHAIRNRGQDRKFLEGARSQTLTTPSRGGGVPSHRYFLQLGHAALIPDWLGM